MSVLVGDCLDVLSGMPDGSVHCCVTSPPYFGLRDYGQDGQIGLEATPDEYVARLISVFAEVKRVLRGDGTLWLNLGDSYYAAGWESRRRSEVGNGSFAPEDRRSHTGLIDGLKAKDLLGVPWMVAFALRADGWYLRSEIIWSKPNPMPESVTDRPTKAHEQVFLLSKSPRYFYDAAAVAEPLAEANAQRTTAHYSTEHYGAGNGGNGGLDSLAARMRDGSVTGRNKRSVWTVSTMPYPDAHFATFPPKLIEPMILAGCPRGGTVLDPFAGSGTTLQVALANGREAVGIELNPEYAPMAERRLAGVTSSMFDVEAA